jgi:hypothetical protein
MLTRAMMMQIEPNRPSRLEKRVYEAESPRLSTICEAAKKPPMALTAATNRRLSRCTRAARKVAATSESEAAR